MVSINVPGDKSITHRALMLASIATGESRIQGALDSADTRATAAALRAFGVNIGDLASELVVRGVGLRGLRRAGGPLDCANSGTTARLLMGLVAGQDFAATFDGDSSLRHRPMRRVTEPLQQMGAEIRELGEADRLPLEVKGGATWPIDHLSPRASAQVKSALLLAGVSGGAWVAVTEPALSRDHTERMLNSMGAVVNTMVTPRGMRIELNPPKELTALDLTVPGDFSSAAFFLARGLLAAPPVQVLGVGVNATRSGFLDVVRRMLGEIHVENRRESANEPIADLIATASKLQATTVEAAEVPRLIDEIPIIAVLAARAQGVTTIHGAGELRVKESDRLNVMVENLRAVGAQAEELPEGLSVTGSDAPLRGRVLTYGDHRIAMAFGILGSIAGNEIEIDEPAVVDVSFPTFWQQLQACRA